MRTRITHIIRPCTYACTRAYKHVHIHTHRLKHTCTQICVMDGPFTQPLIPIMSQIFHALQDIYTCMHTYIHSSREKHLTTPALPIAVELRAQSSEQLKLPLPWVKCPIFNRVGLCILELASELVLRVPLLTRPAEGHTHTHTHLNTCM